MTTTGAGQLQLRSAEGFDVERFTWDAAGNLLDEGTRTADGRIAPLMDNLLRRYNGMQYVYDDWGQVIRRNGAMLQWDAEGHLLSSATDLERASYRYDALGRRIGKQVERVDLQGLRSGPPMRETRFVWEGLRLAQERESTGVVRTYVYDPARAYAPLARVDRTISDARDTVWHYHTDPTGTARQVTDSQGRIVWSGSYAAWGKVRANLAEAAGFVQPLRMPGQFHDEESGLHYNTFRYYDPHAGRFVSPDPIGLAGGLNLYRYAPNPIGWIDPLGLVTQDVLQQIASQIGSDANSVGVYRYTDAGGAPYVGSTTDQNLLTRLGQHIDSGKLTPDQIGSIRPINMDGKPARKIYNVEASEIVRNGGRATDGGTTSNRRAPPGTRDSFKSESWLSEERTKPSRFGSC
ncbi:RHS repeat-associated core domain-containing protein [Paraburkholderia caribensis]|uniref:RHS repeat-associated core domain-containing protein n=1 Tax=Paraburkholderia caribensis TaxID=75105 RepID=UPI0029C9C86D|nr:RHS repeat-associated core domain-containing protein [Paraburkholderia caribensis]